MGPAGQMIQAWVSVTRAAGNPIIELNFQKIMPYNCCLNPSLSRQRLGFDATMTTWL